MRIVSRLNVFKKDYKRMASRGKNMKKLDAVLIDLSNDNVLDPKYRDHKLIGNFKTRRECHIEPDWLLIYRLEKNKLILERTGSHSDLFD